MQLRGCDRGGLFVLRKNDWLHPAERGFLTPEFLSDDLAVATGPRGTPGARRDEGATKGEAANRPGGVISLPGYFSTALTLN